MQMKNDSDSFTHLWPSTAVGQGDGEDMRGTSMDAAKGDLKLLGSNQEVKIVLRWDGCMGGIY